jgi:hypothetical protein
MVPEKGNERSGLAMSALVRALYRKKQCAVLLFVPRVSETGGANAATCVAYPLLVRLFTARAALLLVLPLPVLLRRCLSYVLRSCRQCVMLLLYG